MNETRVWVRCVNCKGLREWHHVPLWATLFVHADHEGHALELYDESGARLYPTPGADVVCVRPPWLA